ncbi:hypothetical protein WME97_18645 [Sorangium sp. So ce367]|uniref:hypothetical protein n=1 Tax=Sorangium sp. So ce367 TaxID=3133305 RepID=UPI003F5E0EEF
MLHPMRGLLDVVAPWLPTSLLAEPWRARIRDLAEQLPPAFDWGLLECRLGQDDPRVDFMVCASARDGGRERLASLPPDHAAAGTLGAAGRFVEEWGRERSPIHRSVPLIWLEYDILPERDATPIVGACVDPTYLSPEPVPPLSIPELRAVCASVLGLVLGRPADEEVLDTLERCAALLPANRHILSLAAMPRRGPRDVRVYVALRLAEIPTWLRAIGWSGFERLIDSGLELLGPGEELFGVHIDVAETVGPYFAVERYAGPTPAATAEGLRLIERLVRSGACAPEKGEAIARWSGATKVDLPGAGWLVRVDRQFYIKLIPRPDAPPEAKAYLGFHPSFTLL